MTIINELAIGESLHSNKLGSDIEIIDIGARQCLLHGRIEATIKFKPASGGDTFTLLATEIYDLLQTDEMEWSQ